MRLKLDPKRHQFKTVSGLVRVRPCFAFLPVVLVSATRQFEVRWLERVYLLELRKCVRLGTKLSIIAWVPRDFLSRSEYNKLSTEEHSS